MTIDKNRIRRVQVINLAKKNVNRLILLRFFSLLQYVKCVQSFHAG